MPCSLHLLFSDNLPTQDDEEHEVLMVETNIDLPPEGLQDREAFGFATSVLANYEDLRALRDDINQWWKDATGVTPAVEFLTSDRALMSAESQEVAAKLPVGHWSMSTFVGYLRQSASARAEARSLVVESCMKTQ